MSHDPKVIRVGIMLPPIAGHSRRGIGTYTKELVISLQKRHDVMVEEIKECRSVDVYDVLHIPYFDPFFLTLPYRGRTPTVVTVHDLIPIVYANHFSIGIRGWIKWQVQKRILQSKNAIITDSYASKRDILSHLDITNEQVYPIYLGVSSDFSQKPKQKADDIRRSYGISDRFILTVGDVNFNKNIPRLIRAFALVKKQYPDVTLCFVGRGFVEDSLELRNIISLIEHLHLEMSVKRLGYIELEDLISLYTSAHCSVQVSTAEGFGLPVLEAMACGCPVVASDCSSIGEIVADAAIRVDPADIRSISAGILRMLADDSQRSKYQKRGWSHVKSFTWDACADKTVSVYRSIICSDTRS